MRRAEVTAGPQGRWFSSDPRTGGRPTMIRAERHHRGVLQVRPAAARPTASPAITTKPARTQVRCRRSEEIHRAGSGRFPRNVIGFLPASARDVYPRPGICYRDVVDLPSCTMALTRFAQTHDHPESKLARDLARAVLRSRAPVEPPGTLPHSQHVIDRRALDGGPPA